MIVLMSVAQAWAGDANGLVALDALTASSQSTEAGSGAEERLSSTELGIHVNGALHEADDRFTLSVDYRGREPLAGTFQNTPRRLLFEALAAYEFIEDRLVLGAGRFIAPAPVFLPVDGARMELSFDRRTLLTAYGGRRGLGTAMNNIALDTVLPAAGLDLLHTGSKVHLGAQAGLSGDQLLLSDDVTEEVDVLHGAARASVFPDDRWAAGAWVSFAEHSSYLIGPTWADAEVENAVDLFSAVAWGSWRPSDAVRVEADAHNQRVHIVPIGTIDPDGAGGTTRRADLVEPVHSDLRLRTAFAPAELGWVRPEVRFRLRPDREELRYGAAVDVDTLGLDGLYLDGRVFADDIMGGPDDVATVDKTFWSAALGWTGHGLDVQGGASFVERAATPVSGRQATAANPGLPERSDDLSPFVLEAQRVAFVRGFYSARRWFAGLDAERNLVDAEMRILLQIGAQAEGRW